MARASTVGTSASNFDRQKVAELTSAMGALVLGIGVGIYFGAALTRLALWFVVLGIVLHGWGMFDRHRLVIAATGALPWWWRALYATCWVGLAALLGYAVYAYAS